MNWEGVEEDAGGFGGKGENYVNWCKYSILESILNGPNVGRVWVWIWVDHGGVEDEYD